jgi:hypothetical protein
MDDVIYAELAEVARHAMLEQSEVAISAAIIQAYAVLRAANITAEMAWPGVVEAGITTPITAA